MKNFWNKIDREKLGTRRKTCTSSTLSTTHPTQTNLGKNSGLRGEGKATNSLKQGTDNSVGCVILHYFYFISTCLRFSITSCLPFIVLYKEAVSSSETQAISTLSTGCFDQHTSILCIAVETSQISSHSTLSSSDKQYQGTRQRYYFAPLKRKANSIMLIRHRKGIRSAAVAVQALHPNAKPNAVVTNFKMDKSS